MKAIWRTLAVFAAALLVVAGIVFGLNDRQVFVSPPDMVAEQFMRKLATERYDVARDHLSEPLREQVEPATLREAMLQLEREVGRVEDVRGEMEWMRGDEAKAAAVLRTETGQEKPVRFHLVRRRGVWNISDLDALLAAPFSAPHARNTPNSACMRTVERHAG